MSNDLTIEDLKKLAGIGGESNTAKAIVFLPEKTSTQHMSEVKQIRNLLDKLKEIDGSVGENWTEVYIGDVKYRATGIRLDCSSKP